MIRILIIAMGIVAMIILAFMMPTIREVMSTVNTTSTNITEYEAMREVLTFAPLLLFVAVAAIIAYFWWKAR